MFWRFTVAVMKVLTFVLFRLRVERLADLPAEGPLLVVANHKSYVDPVLVAVAVPRHVHFMAKAQLFNIPLLGMLIRRLGAFPVHRGRPDRSAISRAIELLKEGESVGLFPEGARIKGFPLGAGERGVSFIAVMAGTPILPVAILGNERIMPPGAHLPRLPRVRVVTGEPFILPAGMSSAAAAADIMEKISQLREEATT